MWVDAKRIAYQNIIAILLSRLARYLPIAKYIYHRRKMVNQRLLKSKDYRIQDFVIRPRHDAFETQRVSKIAAITFDRWPWRKLSSAGGEWPQRYRFDSIMWAGHTIFMSWWLLNGRCGFSAEWGILPTGLAFAVSGWIAEYLSLQKHA